MESYNKQYHPSVNSVASTAGKSFFQPKLTINNPNDKYEQEADAVADKVMQMETPSVQKKSGADSFFSSSPVSITPLQRKCDNCKEEEKMQRKEIDREELTADNNIENYVGGLQSGGQPLPNEARNFYEPRFGYDFSNVKIHTDNVAAKSAQSINALAYTAGNNIVFNNGQYTPGTDSGKKLIAHELTHVVQQSNSNTAVQRQSAPPVSIEAEEKKLKNDFDMIRKTVDVASPADIKAKEQIKKIVLAFQKNFAAYKPSPPHHPLVEIYQDEIHETWRFRKVYSKSDAVELAARLLVIGLPKESAIMNQFGKPSSMIGIFPLDQTDQFHKSYTKAALERVDVTTQAKADASLDVLLASFKYMINEIKGLDMVKVEKDKQYASIYPKDEKIAEIGFFGDFPYYMSLVSHLGKLYGGMQLIIQHKMEKVFTELDAGGNATSLPEVYAILKKIETSIPKEIKFSKPGADSKFLDPAKATTAITRSDFESKDKVHKDFFNTSKTAPSVKIEFYDKDQKEAAEKFLPIGELHKIRYQQLLFIQNFYGLDKQGKKIAGKQGPADLMPGTKHFTLFSLDDWKVYLDAKYDDLVKNQKKSNADAFLTIIRLLESYLLAFTIHTPYNIVDKGDNYLTKTFPKALSGQLIQDCGVYALKIVYLFSLLATRLKLKIQYIMLPNHVGLIIQGDQTPVILVHNDMFTAIPLSEAQFDGLSKENKDSILNNRSLEGYEKAKKAGDTSAFIFTIDKQKQDWQNFSKTKGLKGPLTDEQFLAEKAANLFVNGADMPFAIVDLNAKSYDPKLKNEKIKKNLWAQYEQMVKDTVFFDKKTNEKEFSDTYQFHLRYLNITVAEKNFHNNLLLPYWNNTGKNKWEALVAGLQKKVAINDKQGYIHLLTSYRKEFVEAAKKIAEAHLPIDKEKENIHNIIAAKDPDPLRKGVTKTIGQRSTGDTWRIAFESHADALKTRIDNITLGKETINTGTDITPAFATEADKLLYLP